MSLILLIQLLDFTVETFLKLVIDGFPRSTHFVLPQSGYYYSIKDLENTRHKPSMDFHWAWDEVVGRLRDPANGLSITNLPLRRDMDRLHDIRNDVQHKGAIPNPKDATKYVPLVESFLRDSYQHIFTVDFDPLSALSLIKHTTLREQLEKAQDAFKQGAWTKAVCEAVIAFHLLLQMAGDLAHPEPLGKIREKISEADRAYDGTTLNFLSSGQREGIGGMLKEISRLREQVAVTGFRLDYPEYVSLKPILPQVRRGKFDEQGHWKDEWDVEVPNGWSDERNQWMWREYSEVEAQEIVNFVERQILNVQASGAIEV